MTIPRIYTEDQFPLNDDPFPIEYYPEDESSFLVLVDWGDVEESPTQAVTRLNQEAMEYIERHADAERALRRRVDADAALEQYVIASPDQADANRRLVHNECGRSIGVLTGDPTVLSQIMERVRAHDCTAAALIAAKDNARVMAGRAVGLLDGSDETTDPEYLRALTEMVYEAAGLPSERKQEVAAYLWEQASTTGECPTI